MTAKNEPITITLILFSLIRDLCEFSEQKRTLVPGTTAGTVIDALIADYPALQPHASTLLIAINQEYATPDHLLEQGDVLALFPPVSGG